MIGIDSADWKIIDQIAEAHEDGGGMPNLMRLREQGAWGPIETLTDIPLSPVICTSIATGKTAAKNAQSSPTGSRANASEHRETPPR